MRKDHFRKIRRNMLDFKTRMVKPKKGKGSIYRRNLWKKDLD